MARVSGWGCEPVHSSASPRKLLKLRKIFAFWLTVARGSSGKGESGTFAMVSEAVEPLRGKNLLGAIPSGNH